MSIDPNNYRPEIQGWSSDILPKYYEWAKSLNDGARCVEVGVYHGRSLLFLAEALWEMGKRECDVRGLDTWAYGLQDEKAFFGNVEKIGDAGKLVSFKPISSTCGEGFFGDGDLDLVFIDADHFYMSVKADLAAWWPKVKSGGIFAGHDYSDATGVKQAVDEFARDNPTQPIEHFQSVWWTVKR